MDQQFPFIRLPVELRDRVYKHYFDPAPRLTYYEDNVLRYRFELNIYLVCKQVCMEARRVFRRQNLFVRIETPWPEAGGFSSFWQLQLLNFFFVPWGCWSKHNPCYRCCHNNDPIESHSAVDGRVPIVATSRYADVFTDYAFRVVVDTHTDIGFRHHHHTFRFVIMLQDVHLFTRGWYYSALNFEDLNPHLTLNLERNDFTHGELALGTQIQKKFLMPFADVKDLDRLYINGFDGTVTKQLRAAMQVPVDSPRVCFEKCAAFIDEADAAISKKQYDEALALYVKAFFTIHIKVAGRNRVVLADRFFDKSVDGGPFDARHAIDVRLIFRLRLVASVIKVYLKRTEWEDAEWWGKRSIDLIEASFDHGYAGLSDFADKFKNFAGAVDLGLVYLRTAIAMKKQEVAALDEGKSAGKWIDQDKYYRVGGRLVDAKVVEKEMEEYGAARNFVIQPDEFD